MERIPSKVSHSSLPSSYIPPLRQLWSTTCPNCMPVVILWPPSKLSTLEPMPPKLHLMIQEDCTPSSAWLKEHASCSHSISGLTWVWSTVPWVQLLPSATSQDKLHQLYQSLSWSGLTPTQAPPTLMAQFLSSCPSHMVCVWSPVLTTTTTTQAGLGCHHP